MELSTVKSLVAAARPFVRIDGIKPQAWCRNVQAGPRLGPWRYQAAYTVLDEHTWSQKGEVLYFVTDQTNRLRLVGESAQKLKDRWRLSPMHDVETRAPLGRKALFHSTAWGAIERGLGIEHAPFLVSALFVDEVERIVPRSSLASLGGQRDHHCLRVEQAIIRSHKSAMGLWNGGSKSR